MSGAPLQAIPGVTTPQVTARYGVKGAQAAAWLAEHGIAVPAAPNRVAYWDANGAGRCLRLGNSEFLIEHDAGSAAVPTQAAVDGAWLLLRSDHSLLLDGALWPAALAQACSFDFRHFHDQSDLVVMTLLAGIGVTMTREPRPVDERRIALRLWCDASYAPYLQQCLQQLASPDHPGELR